MRRWAEFTASTMSARDDTPSPCGKPRVRRTDAGLAWILAGVGKRRCLIKYSCRVSWSFWIWYSKALVT